MVDLPQIDMLFLYYINIFIDFEGYFYIYLCVFVDKDIKIACYLECL